MNNRSLLKLLNTPIKEYKAQAKELAKSFADKKLEKLKEHDMDLKQIDPIDLVERGFLRKITNAKFPKTRKSLSDIRVVDKSAVREYIKTQVSNAEEDYKTFTSNFINNSQLDIIDAEINVIEWNHLELIIETSDDLTSIDIEYELFIYGNNGNVILKIKSPTTQ